jgi:hypothetical protein
VKTLVPNRLLLGRERKITMHGITYIHRRCLRIRF